MYWPCRVNRGRSRQPVDGCPARRSLRLRGSRCPSVQSTVRPSRGESRKARVCSAQGIRCASPPRPRVLYCLAMACLWRRAPWPRGDAEGAPFRGTARDPSPRSLRLAGRGTPGTPRFDDSCAWERARDRPARPRGADPAGPPCAARAPDMRGQRAPAGLGLAPATAELRGAGVAGASSGLRSLGVVFARSEACEGRQDGSRGEGRHERRRCAHR